jgi:hypothetical protein
MQSKHVVFRHADGMRQVLGRQLVHGPLPATLPVILPGGERVDAVLERDAKNYVLYRHPSSCAS